MNGLGWEYKNGGADMSKRKKDPSKVGLSSSQVKGQGTTTNETGSFEAPSSRHKQKRT
jgi:hypothetical protein